MRTLPAILPAILLGAALAVPAASAQRAADAPSRFDTAPAFTSSASGLRAYVSRDAFRMAQTVEMSAGSIGGMGYGLGSYTQSLFWQPTGRLAARVDVTAAVPFGGSFGLNTGDTGSRFGQGVSPTVYLRNAELAYRPNASTELRLQVQQVPSGVAGLSAYDPYGYGATGLGVQSRQSDLFWRSR